MTQLLAPSPLNPTQGQQLVICGHDDETSGTGHASFVLVVAVLKCECNRALAALSLCYLSVCEPVCGAEIGAVLIVHFLKDL